MGDFITSDDLIAIEKRVDELQVMHAVKSGD
jgi:hypothetical protein